MNTISFIAWTPYHRRSQILAQQFGASLHFVSYGKQGNLAQAPLRYLRQARQTWRILSQERPDVVFVQNPPIFCALLAFCYARRRQAMYAIDSHTGAFLDRRWRWSVPLHRLLSRRALVTLVHNRAQARIVEGWGCRYCLLAYTPGGYPAGEPYPLVAGYNVAVISSFAPDEPLEAIFQAASQLPAVHFYITGNYLRASPDLLQNKSGNIHLTGYLPDNQYSGLLREVDAVMVLTTRDNTLLMGAFEAVSLGTPLIISDWPVLKEYFSLGAVYVRNTADDICEGVRRAQRDAIVLQRDILVLQERLQVEWQQKFSELQLILDASLPRRSGFTDAVGQCN